MPSASTVKKPNSASSTVAHSVQSLPMVGVSHAGSVERRSARVVKPLAGGSDGVAGRLTDVDAWAAGGVWFDLADDLAGDGGGVAAAEE
jgi:hypothetical protein